MVGLIKRIRFFQIYYTDILKKFLGLKSLNYNDLIYMSYKSIAFRFGGETDPFLQYISMLNILRQDKSMKNGLELGGGYSTVVLTKLVIENDCKITSIDVNPFKYKAILPSLRHRKYLFSLIDIVEDLTIDFETLVNFYKYSLQLEIEKCDANKFKETLKKYLKKTNDDGSYICRSVSPIDYLYPDGKFNINNTLLASEVLDTEKKFYSQFDRVKKKGFIDKVLKEKIVYDFIFFDCGELSSLVEWFMLKDTIRKGGYAFFHDIYFPKSIKNFIVATLVELSDEWDIIYTDTATPQGMLIAKRL
tara:strand:- start:17329 stop:18240 length:912 start_codon:yes stop_codon:yes gene_type:complete